MKILGVFLAIALWIFGLAILVTVGTVVSPPNVKFDFSQVAYLLVFSYSAIRLFSDTVRFNEWFNSNLKTK